MAVKTNINSVVENNIENFRKQRLCEGFYNSTKCVIFVEKSTLDKFFYSNHNKNQLIYDIMI